MTRRFLPAVTAALALLAATPAHASVVFDPFGTGSGTTVDVFDPAPGNSISVGLTTSSEDEDLGELHFQANLFTFLTNNLPTFGTVFCTATTPCFTVVASFTEELATITTDEDGNTNLTFDFSGVNNNSFAIYAQPVGVQGDPLTGACFVDDCGGVLILSGELINDGVFSASFTIDPFDPLGPFGNLDQAPNSQPASDDYPGVDSLTGVGAFQTNIEITGFDPLYFPFLTIGTSFIFATSEQSLPYATVDPSACFFATSAGGCVANGGIVGVGQVGTVNGLNGTATMLQTDSSLNFQTVGVVPEPATLTLLGLGLLGAAGARRRQQKK